MHQLLQQVWLASRKTVVFVTHDVREALLLGDRVVVMAARPGRLLEDLEVRLPRPRDPDDEALVAMSRRIREDLRRAEAAGARAHEESGDAKAEERAPAGGLPAGLGDPLGAGG
jgi:NitT/TauT family transport system ATP-binding protein